MKALKVFEKFTEDSDPVKDMNLGYDYVRNFDNYKEAAKWIIKNIPWILKTEKIPEDIIRTIIYQINEKYVDILCDYSEKYIRIDDKIVEFNYFSWLIHNILNKRGYKVFAEGEKRYY
jgi:hypothetical protein